MMDDNKILERLRYSLRKNDVLNLAEIFSQKHNGIKILLDFTASSDAVLAFHAAWVLEHIVIGNHQLLQAWIIPIVTRMPETNHPAVQRHFSKIIRHTLECGAANKIIESKIHTEKIDLLIEVCFEWLLNPQTPIAVKANCMDILMYFAPRNEWIKEELPHVIRLNMIDASPGISSKSRKILEQLSNYEAT